MSTVDKLKVLVAPFVQLDPTQISAATFIDRRAIKGSILVHRMYAVLQREGFQVPERKVASTFGELISLLGLNGEEAVVPVEQPEPATLPEGTESLIPGISLLSTQVMGGLAVGIDIESISNMPMVSDFREDAFYRENFSEREIAYCILQQEPLQSFTGKFCAKEAIVKADKGWKEVPFNRIEILNMADGSPCFGGFVLSIAHTPEHAIAIALRGGAG